ncbi:MAG: hypothetical protein HOQ05_01530 [Corynebacteriales bacterium]|nr:hypothetical protein [Mycobacteriales bacterium]
MTNNSLEKTSAPAPLVWTSGSAVKLSMISALGVPVRHIEPRTEFDEREFQDTMLADAQTPKMVRALAIEKARHAAADLEEILAEEQARLGEDVPQIILSGDVVVELDGIPLHKPSSPEEAEIRIKSLRGREVRFVSALAALNRKTGEIFSGVTTASMRVDGPDKLTDELVREIVATDTYVLGATGGLNLAGYANGTPAPLRAFIHSPHSPDDDVWGTTFGVPPGLLVKLAAQAGAPIDMASVRIPGHHILPGGPNMVTNRPKPALS